MLEETPLTAAVSPNNPAMATRQRRIQRFSETYWLPLKLPGTHIGLSTFGVWGSLARVIRFGQFAFAARQGILAVLLAAGSLLVSACLDGSEDIRIERDGAGRASFDYVLPSAAVASQGGTEALRKPIESWIRGEEGLRLETLVISDEGENTRLSLKLSFDCVTDLIRAASGKGSESLPNAMRHLLGTFHFTRNGRHVEFRRTVRPVEALGGSLLLVPQEELARHRLIYRISLPVPPDTHNATSTLDGGRTLVWEIPLDQAVGSPPKLEFTATLPVPLWVWGCAALMGAAVAALAVAFLRMRRGRNLLAG
jgi:hypothetical protein